VPGSNLENRLSKLNKLESAIIKGEDSVEDARWAQAREVVGLLDESMSKREVARAWINGRTNKPYNDRHVRWVEAVWRRFGADQGPRPRWADAYQTVKEGSDEVIDTGQRWKQMVEGRPPTTETSAEKLVEGLIKGPKHIRDQVEFGLRFHETHKEPPPTRSERKAGEAMVEENVVEPIKRAMAPITKMELVINLESATSLLHEMIEDGALDPASMEQIETANTRWQAELEVARALTEEGVR
jgi:hypothetical protein